MDKDIVSILTEKFPHIEVSLEKVQYCGTISVFLISVKTEELLNNTWSRAMGLIAAYYQPYLKNDFERWNIYIIYLCYEEPSINLTYQIETNKFSSRKIVLTLQKNKASSLTKNNIIASYITNKDISTELIKENRSKIEYFSDSEIWKFINKGKFKTNKGGTSEVDSVLSKIENLLSDEDKEG